MYGMKLRQQLIFWCQAYNVDTAVLDNPRVKAAIEDRDPVDTLRWIKRCAPAGFDEDTFTPASQLAFISMFQIAEAK